MKFKTIASGSKGNCYLLKTEKGSLLIEAGIPVNKIKRTLGFDFSNVQGCLITHEHGDHAKAIHGIAKLGIDVYASEGTLQALNCMGHRFVPIVHGKAKTIGEFDVLSFNTEHDAAEPLGFLIRCGNEKLLFATDTCYLRYKFNNLTHIAIECNYVRAVMEDMLEKELVDIKRVTRTIKNHMSLESLIDFLKSNNLSKVREIHLLHLSNENSSIPIIKKEIRKVFKGNLFIADG
jgi:phosphoribosyl 1,2-cyclic phosphodiesterase